MGFTHVKLNFMHLEVDLSGVLGKTSIPTVVAFSNKKKASILVLGRDKKEIISTLRLVKGITIRTYLRLLAVLIFLLELLRNEIPDFPKENIQFSRVGKASGAHKLANSVFSAKIKPDKLTTAKEILEFFKLE